MMHEKYTKPDITLELTAEQIAIIEPLLQRRVADIGNGGLILGSVGLSNQTIALKYVERAVGIEIYELAYQKIEQIEQMEEQSDVNS